MAKTTHSLKGVRRIRRALGDLGRAALGEAAFNTTRSHLTGAARLLTRANQRLFAEYCRGRDELKLHIGCATYLLDEWLNADYRPIIAGIYHFDARKRFPFADDTFTYIFSEHMIEHIDYEHGRKMLEECARVLRPGGKIRISTPDLRFFTELHRDSEEPIKRDYVRWSIEEHLPAGTPEMVSVVINNNFRDWGHKFIYDAETLADSMRRAGLASITAQPVGESKCEALRGLENEARMPQRFLRLDTLTLEATKP